MTLRNVEGQRGKYLTLELARTRNPVEDTNLAIVVFTNLGSEAGLICKPQLHPITKPRCGEAMSRNPINKDSVG
jgi:hypothetical protein